MFAEYQSRLCANGLDASNRGGYLYVREPESHPWPCGCLINDAGAHRVGCPDHTRGRTGISVPPAH